MSDEAPNLTPLWEASIEQITDELGRRNEALLICYSQSRTESASMFDYHFRGGLIHVIGLAEITASLLKSKFDPRVHEPGDEPVSFEEIVENCELGPEAIWNLLKERGVL